MLEGSVHVLRVDSQALADNPLGDPAVREVGVYLPPGGATPGLPMILVLAGFTGTGARQLVGTAWDPSLPQRFEQALRAGRAAPTAFVFPDCFTRLGGSQYINSPATGAYQDHLLEEVLPLVEQTYGVGGAAGRRGVMGKSSGGFGALHLCLTRPGVFGALASHSGDCAFDLCYQPDFPALARQLELHGGVEEFLAAFEAAPRKTGALIEAMNVLAMAAAYSPVAGQPLGLELPFEPLTLELRGWVWERWLEHDPVVLAGRCADALRGLALVFVDAGRRDEYRLQYGARRLVDELRRQGVEVRHEEFDDGHMGVGYRYDVSLPLMTRALSP